MKTLQHWLKTGKGLGNKKQIKVSENHELHVKETFLLHANLNSALSQ